MAFNVIGNLMLSRDLLDSQCKEGYEFFQATGMAAMWAGTPNVADFLPFLKWFDPQGLRRNMSRDMARALKIVEGFVKERLEEYKLGNEEKNNKDFLDTLLEFEETTSAATEWAMAELLRKPEAMRKVKEVLNEVVGENRNVEESDIEKLPYLQAVVKEALRLHPSVPLLVPRNTMQDTNFMGYHIAKDTQVFVNAWAIGRDPDSWEDPLTFKPERFLGSNIDYKGQNFELIPFGSGRRICIDSGLFFSLEKIMWASVRRKVLTGSKSASLALERSFLGTQSNLALSSRSYSIALKEMLPRRSNNSQYVDSHGYLRFPVGSSPVREVISCFRVDPSISILSKAFLQTGLKRLFHRQNLQQQNVNCLLMKGQEE
ncbi:hypothetical protein GH714_026503 [Hevea brasiliensis]|uniref:Cytochrome P450 n=1 Tax=Hevea brasiliensis TaxID=3981 RepID=A0A6A6N705_HEVBR|nr:hypothetical protein GH714_026503 [Hevea brasiliensis]